jgi:2',5'-phosphodiesterase
MVVAWCVLLLALLRLLSVEAMSRVRVVSYNVLSSHLASPSYFTHCLAGSLDPTVRYDKLCKKLDLETAKKSIICLQEVSTDWAGLLHVYFFSKNYHLVTALYGNKLGGYMGVATAVPMDSFEIQRVQIKRLADMIRRPSPSPPSILQKTLSFLQSLFWRKPVEDSWQRSISRNNELIAVTVTPRNQNNPFVIGNYHMPCEFRLPQVMVTHSCLAAQYVQKIASGTPHILLGDFNFKPGSTMHRILTEGEVESRNLDLPAPLEGFPWKASVSPLRSAYQTATGREPDFTNNARIRDEDPFVDTLDYIFVSPEWAVDSVDALPLRSEIEGPFPSASEPSDHLLLAADLSLPLKRACLADINS